jgi:hypothetical protein
MVTIRRENMDPNYSNEVVVTDIRMSFISMVIFMVKWAIAAIPAIIILALLGALLTAIFSGLVGSGYQPLGI